MLSSVDSDSALVYALSALNIGPLSSKRFSPNSCTVFVVVGVKGCVHGMCLNDGEGREADITGEIGVKPSASESLQDGRKQPLGGYL